MNGVVIVFQIKEEIRQHVPVYMYSNLIVSFLAYTYTFFYTHNYYIHICSENDMQTKSLDH